MPLPYKYLNNDFSKYFDLFKTYTSVRITYTHTRSLRDILEKPYYAGCILSGCCRLLLSRDEGQEKVNAVLHTGSFLQTYSRSHIKDAGNIMILEPYPEVEFLLFSKERYERMLKENPDIMLKMLTFYENLVVSLQCDMYDLLYSSGLKRVALFLYSHGINQVEESDSINHLENICIPATQELIASYIALDRTNVAKYLKQLKEQGVIDSKRGVIRILNLEKLKTIASQ